MNLGHPNHRNGFTLAELLIVVAVLAAAAALLTPRISALTEAGGEDRAFRILAGAVARAQDLALLEHHSQTLIVDLTARRISIGTDREPTDLPANCRIALALEDAADWRESGRVEIPVDRDGGILPFRVRIGDRLRASAHPFTGILELEENSDR